MWDIVMIGLGIGLFIACLAYITLCERLKDSQETAPATVPVDEVSR